MSRRTTPTFAVLAMAGGAVLLAQGAVTMRQEPHHKQQTYVRDMRVFEMNLAPKEMTLDHVRDHDAVTIVIGAATTRTQIAGQAWSAPREHAVGETEINMYTGAAITQRVENVGTTPYRIFTIENMKDKGWSMPKRLDASGTTLLQESRSFAVYDIKLSAATPQTAHQHANPSFTTVLSGVVEVQGGGGEAAFKLDMPGRWFPWSGIDDPASTATAAHTLTAVGGDAHLIEVEVR